MRIFQRVNLLSAFIVVLCFLCTKTLIKVIQTGVVQVKTVSFTWVDNPFMFCVSVSVLLAGIVAMVYFVLFADRDDLKIKETPDKNADV